MLEEPNVTVMKVITSMTGNMVMEYSNGAVETFTEESTNMMREMAMERCTGPMEVVIKENGSKEYNMGTER